MKQKNTELIEDMYYGNMIFDKSVDYKDILNNMFDYFHASGVMNYEKYSYCYRIKANMMLAYLDDYDALCDIYYYNTELVDFNDSSFDNTIYYMRQHDNIDIMNINIFKLAKDIIDNDENTRNKIILTLLSIVAAKEIPDDIKNIFSEIYTDYDGAPHHDFSFNKPKLSEYENDRNLLISKIKSNCRREWDFRYAFGDIVRNNPDTAIPIILDAITEMYPRINNKNSYKLGTILSFLDTISPNGIHKYLEKYNKKYLACYIEYII